MFLNIQIQRPDQFSKICINFYAVHSSWATFYKCIPPTLKPSFVINKSVVAYTTLISVNHFYGIFTVLEHLQVASLAQLLPPRSHTWVIRCRIALCVELLLPDCVPFSCCSLRDCIAHDQLLLSSRLVSASAAAALSSRLASASAAARRLRPFQLLPDFVRFGCCFPIASASTLLPDGVHFVCCSPIASASTAAPWLCLLRLLLPASYSGRFQPCPLLSNILRRVRSTKVPRY